MQASFQMEISPSNLSTTVNCVQLSWATEYEVCVHVCVHARSVMHKQPLTANFTYARCYITLICYAHVCFLVATAKHKTHVQT